MKRGEELGGIEGGSLAAFEAFPEGWLRVTVSVSTGSRPSDGEADTVKRR